MWKIFGKFYFLKYSKLVELNNRLTFKSNLKKKTQIFQQLNKFF